MQDRFKFRVWDKEQNKYLPLVSRGKDIDFWIELDNTGVYLVERDNNRDVVYFIDITQHVIIQQCTGLKDKNGKLIYEGDIVKIGNGSINGSVIETIREVKWVINTWNIPVWVVDKPDFSHYVEVIGNIYENPELLEE